MIATILATDNAAVSVRHSVIGPELLHYRGHTYDTTPTDIDAAEKFQNVLTFSCGLSFSFLSVILWKYLLRERTNKIEAG